MSYKPKTYEDGLEQLTKIFEKLLQNEDPESRHYEAESAMDMGELGELLAKRFMENAETCFFDSWGILKITYSKLEMEIR